MKRNDKPFKTMIIFVISLSIFCMVCVYVFDLIEPSIESSGVMQRLKRAEPQFRDLFCDRLAPGMTQAETLDAVAQIGPFWTRVEEENGDALILAVGFKDENLAKKYDNGFYLLFRNGMYQNGGYHQIINDTFSVENFDCDE
jgi:hypothetical protein